jgi:hypothetical protein
MRVALGETMMAETVGAPARECRRARFFPGDSSERGRKITRSERQISRNRPGGVAGFDAVFGNPVLYNKDRFQTSNDLHWLRL